MLCLSGFELNSRWVPLMKAYVSRKFYNNGLLRSNDATAMKNEVNFNKF